MRYLDSFRFVTLNPNWFVNLLLMAVCFFIPGIGPIIVMGYLFEVFDALRERRGGGYPSFDFNRFVPYLTRGIWIFIALFIVQLITAIPIVAFSGCCGLGGALLAESTKGLSMIGVWFVIMLMSTIVGVLGGLIQWPVTIHAGMRRTIDFSSMVAFTKDFARRNTKEILFGQLFVVFWGFVLSMLGLLACFVGVYVMAAFIMLAQHQLMHQVYELHLERGGLAVDVPAPLNAELVSPDPSSSPTDDLDG